jgi:hypothetical protein
MDKYESACCKTILAKEQEQPAMREKNEIEYTLLETFD